MVKSEKRGASKEAWENRRNINLKPTSFNKLKILKDAMKASTWEDLINKLYEEKVQKNIVKL